MLKNGVKSRLTLLLSYERFVFQKKISILEGDFEVNGSLLLISTIYIHIYIYIGRQRLTTEVRYGYIVI